MQDLRKSFSKIYDKYINKIYRFVFLKVNSQEAAQDLTSETFLKFWERINEEQDFQIQNPNAFLYQIARNLVTDHYRQKGQIQLVSTDAIEVKDPQIDLQRQAVLDSDFKQIQEAMGSLKEEYQDVVIWHYLDELSVPEISKILDKSENNVRVLICRALEALRQRMNE